MRDDASHCHIQGLRDIDPRFTVSQDGIDKLTREMTMRSPVASSAGEAAELTAAPPDHSFDQKSARTADAVEKIAT